MHSQYEKHPSEQQHQSQAFSQAFALRKMIVYFKEMLLGLQSIFEIINLYGMQFLHPVLISGQMQFSN